MHICLSAPNTLVYPSGGHIWVFLNWALGFASLGHEVTWLDVIDADTSPEEASALLKTLRDRLAPFGLAERVALCTPDGDPCAHEASLPLRPLESALGADLLCDHRYNLAAKIVGRFARSMLVDIDPGQFHVAWEKGVYNTAPHGAYFTVGEWTKFVDVHPPPFQTFGLDWKYIPPPVALNQWPVTPAPDGAAFTTISNWFMPREWMPDENGVWYDNSKRAAFQPYLDLPLHSARPIELCSNICTYQPELDLLAGHGWRVSDSRDADDPQDYRRYIQNSLAEFSCAKPAYVRMNSGWLSDRTVCYLASGKPVVIQKTGPSDLFPDDLGMLRFDDYEGAKRALAAVDADYEKHSRAARALAEEHLDARKVLMSVLETVI